MLTPKVAVLLTVYLTSLFASNTLGIKLMPFVFGTHLSVAVFSFPVVFLMTDVVGELYGKKTARMFVLAGFVSMIVFLLYSMVSLALPWSFDGIWAKEGYEQIFGVSVRFTLASLVAYAIGEYQDIATFFLIRRATGSRYFWLRSNLSNLWSQFLDTTIFMLIAFVGIYPFATIVAIILPWWLYKVLMGACYTPLSYAAVYLLREKNAR